jgi:hypothetical protein
MSDYYTDSPTTTKPPLAPKVNDENKKPAEQDVSQLTEQNLLSIPINNENIALNVMVSYLNLAQRRGCFNIAESAKIWECIQMFQKGQQ